MSKRSGAGILAAIPFVAVVNGKVYASRGENRAKNRGALLSKGEPQGKGGEPGTPRGVPVKGNGGAWMSDNS